MSTAATSVPASSTAPAQDALEALHKKRDQVFWNLFHTYVRDNPRYLVDHHLKSFNWFMDTGLPRIFRENNPIRFIDNRSIPDTQNQALLAMGEEVRNEISFYLGGRDGTKIYFGKPVLYNMQADESGEAAVGASDTRFLFPNEARLRNMTYGVAIYYDVDMDIQYLDAQGEVQHHQKTTEKVFLGQFPIMLQSNLCVLSGMDESARFWAGECRSDPGGYFLVSGKEKVVVAQEEFADNLLSVRRFPDDGEHEYAASASVRSVSEDSSKPTRPVHVRLVAPSATRLGLQFEVEVPDVRRPVPLFILMRALGLLSDLDIIETCLLDLVSERDLIDHFRASVHDAGMIFTQAAAMEYIGEFTKTGTRTQAMSILCESFLPHVGEFEFRDKAYYVGYMVHRVLRVFLGRDLPTNRDGFHFKRVHPAGAMLYPLYREYFLQQKQDVARKVSKMLYYHGNRYRHRNVTGGAEEDDDDGAGGDERAPVAANPRAPQNGPAAALDVEAREPFLQLVSDANMRHFFSDRLVERGVNKAYRGDWGGTEYTKKPGVVQTLERVNWYKFISQLRKINLPLPEAIESKVEPRLLNSTQWNLIDFLDTPDGGNIGVHKHLALGAQISNGDVPTSEAVAWLFQHQPVKALSACSRSEMATGTKVFVNGRWVGMIERGLAPKVAAHMRWCRRNGALPVLCSVSFHSMKNEFWMQTDAGRVMFPQFYMQRRSARSARGGNFPNFVLRRDLCDRLAQLKCSWTDLVSGQRAKPAGFRSDREQIWNWWDLMRAADAQVSEAEAFRSFTDPSTLSDQAALVEFLDTIEAETTLVLSSPRDWTPETRATHMEISPTLALGILSNMIIFPEHNPIARNVFSCGQTRHAASIPHTNYMSRMEKMIVLESAQTPLVTSRFLEYFTQHRNPYGANAIVAIMCHTAYNVEDAVLLNQGALDRGLFMTTVFTTYESHEECSAIASSSAREDESGGGRAAAGEGGGAAEVHQVVPSVNVSEARADTYFMSPVAQNVEGRRGKYNYHELDDRGLIRPNARVDDHTMLIGRGERDTRTPTLFHDASVKPKRGQTGYVDKVFVTDAPRGFNVAKVRVRELRRPQTGDKFASRAGQKGTAGLIVAEQDMPFLPDGTRPDIIINPHALPSRMTIGHLLESMFGIACSSVGMSGDCTAFQESGSKYDMIGPVLTANGFHHRGNHVVCNGLTGEQIQADVFAGPTYYMRLKQMTKDKVNSRGTGPMLQLTRQPVQGRANEGGLKIGEMERDILLGHGLSRFVSESMMERSDEYYMAVCNQTGCVAIYNPDKNLMVSPQVDGPVRYVYSQETGDAHLDTVQKYGRSFSIIRVPYAFKLLWQELDAANIQMYVITEDNFDQCFNMSRARNLSDLLGMPATVPTGAVATLSEEQMRAVDDKFQVSENHMDFVARVVQPQLHALSALQRVQNISVGASSINARTQMRKQQGIFADPGFAANLEDYDPFGVNGATNLPAAADPNAVADRKAAAYLRVMANRRAAAERIAAEERKAAAERIAEANRTSAERRAEAERTAAVHKQFDMIWLQNRDPFKPLPLPAAKNAAVLNTVDPRVRRSMDALEQTDAVLDELDGQEVPRDFAAPRKDDLSLNMGPEHNDETNGGDKTSVATSKAPAADLRIFAAPEVAAAPASARRAIPTPTRAASDGAPAPPGASAGVPGTERIVNM